MTAENFFKPSGAKIGIFFMIPVVGILIELIIASQNINFYGGISNSCKMGILWIPFAPVAINSCIHEIIVLNYDTAWYPYFYSKIISWLLTLAYWYLLAAALCGSMFFFDGTIQRWRAKALLDKARAQGKGRGILHLRGLLRQVHDQYSHDGASYYSVFAGGGVRLRGSVGYEADVRELERRITHLMAT